MDISVRTLPTNAKKCSTPKVFMIITFAPDRDNQAVTALAAASGKGQDGKYFCTYRNYYNIFFLRCPAKV